MSHWLLAGLLAAPLSLAQTPDAVDPATDPDTFELPPTLPIEDWPVAETLPPDGEFEWLRAEGYDPVVCPFRGRIDYKPGEIECGIIRVPENREVAGSRTIELHFVRFPARGEDHEGDEVETRDDPVIYLTGGPGVTVEGYVRRLQDHRLTSRRDLYILEQRGVGHSGDFCPFGLNRNRADQVREDFMEAQLAVFDVTRDCIVQASDAGVDVAAYHTFENARDIRALRQALGLGDWNVWGISYGSVLGQAYLQVDPDGIRATVLDAIVPLDLHDLMRLPHWHRENLDRLYNACREQEACQRSYGDLEERYENALGRINESSIGVEVEADERYPEGMAWFHPDLVVGLPFGMLYEQSAHPAVPAVMSELARAVNRDNRRVFKALALAEGGGDGGFSRSIGMSTAVRCLDGYVDELARHAESQLADHPLLAPGFGFGEISTRVPEMCREAGLESRDPASFEMVETDQPVLIVNGAWDPITPVPLAEYILPYFENGQLAIFPHAGHGPTRSVPCAGDWMNEWLDDPEAEAGTGCVEEGEEAAQFLAPIFRTSAVQRGIIMNAESETRLRAHAAWGGISTLLVVVGWLGLIGGWLGRRLNRLKIEAGGGTRFLVFLAGFAALAWAAGLGAAAHATTEISETVLIFGMVGWATWVAWLAPVAALLGLVGLIQSWRYGKMIGLGSRLGLRLTALATISLSVFGLVWGLWPL